LSYRYGREFANLVLFFWVLTLSSPGKGAPGYPELGARYVKTDQELFPSEIKLGCSRTIRPRGSSLTTRVQCFGCQFGTSELWLYYMSVKNMPMQSAMVAVWQCCFRMTVDVCFLPMCVCGLLADWITWLGCENKFWEQVLSL
jgi:hypothetical protein